MGFEAPSAPTKPMEKADDSMYCLVWTAKNRVPEMSVQHNTFFDHLDDG